MQTLFQFVQSCFLNIKQKDSQAFRGPLALVTSKQTYRVLLALWPHANDGLWQRLQAPFVNPH